MKEEHDVFLDNIRQALDESCETLDGRTASRLTRARHRALEQARPAGRRFWLYGPATAFLVALLIVAAFFHGNRGNVFTAMNGLDDLEIIAAQESPEFYADLDFYEWLAGEENHAG